MNKPFPAPFSIAQHGQVITRNEKACTGGTGFQHFIQAQ